MGCIQHSQWIHSEYVLVTLQFASGKNLKKNQKHNKNEKAGILVIHYVQTHISYDKTRSCELS